MFSFVRDIVLYRDQGENRTRDMIDAINDAMEEPPTAINFVAGAKVTFATTIDRLNDEIQDREAEMVRLRAELDGLYCVKQAYQVGMVKLNGKHVNWEDIQP